MTLNRTEIMTAAWNETREMMRMGYAAHQLRKVFTYCLRRAWAAAKAAPRSINLATVTEIRLDGLARAYEVAA